MCSISSYFSNPGKNERGRVVKKNSGHYYKGIFFILLGSYINKHKLGPMMHKTNSIITLGTLNDHVVF